VGIELLKGVSGSRRTVVARAVRSMAAAACVVALAGGCGSGALSGPGGDESPDVGATGGGGARGGSGGDAGGKGEDGGGEEYSWGLPEGPAGVNPPAGVYASLQKGECGQAETTLNGYFSGGLIERGDEPLFRAGIDLCRGDVPGARKHLAAFRWPGSSGGWPSCHLYRAAASVVHQRPGSSFVAVCPPIPPISPEPSVESSAGPSEEPPPSVQPDGDGI
jgi:hypothetical protein